MDLLKSYISTIFLKRSFKTISISNKYDCSDISVWKNNKDVVIVLIDLSNTGIKNIGEYAQNIKKEIAKEIGSKGFSNALRMQMIFIGDNLLDKSQNIKKYADRINSQKVVLQSIHVVDNSNRLSKSVKTWGQFFTGKYQDMIEVVIELYLKNIKKP